MVTEDKELLIDLCNRLPYGVMLQISYKDVQGNGTIKNRDVMLTDRNLCHITSPSHWIYYRPYLRDLSDITNEETEEYYNYLTNKYNTIDCFSAYHIIDWLNEYHFDYRGFIGRKMAIEIIKEELDKMRYTYYESNT